MATTDGRSIRGTFLTPTVNGESNLPALPGLKALRENGAILCLHDLTIAFCGKEKPKIEYPSGTEIFQLECAPSGHLMLPCSDFQNQKVDTQSTLVFTSGNQVQPPTRQTMPTIPE